MQTFRGGMPIGSGARLLLGLVWAAMFLQIRFFLFTPLTLTFAGLAFASLLLSFVRSRIEVAEDGLFIRWLAYRRFLPFDRIEGIAFEAGEADVIRRRHSPAVMR